MLDRNDVPERSPVISILFVDDEPDILSGLRDLLRRHRKEWEMRFATRGQEALALLQERPADVVVSDMRMPGMDGATLLQHVRDAYPRTVRIVLSGQMDLDVAMRTVSAAHQFLSKPCDASQLYGVIRRAYDLRDVLTSHELRSLVGGVAQLPSCPRTYRALDSLLSDPAAPMEEVARIIEMDVAMCAKILQLVNSAFFGLPKRITSVLEATRHLGMLMIRNLALSMGTFSTFEFDDRSRTAASELLQRHSILTAHLARAMFDDKRRGQDAFMAGMLHEIGSLVLLTCPSVGVGARATLVGAYLLGIWGIPYPIVEAVAHHDNPGRVPHTAFDLPDAVHLAHHLATELVAAVDCDPACHEIDLPHLDGVGIGERQVDEWRALGAKMVREGAM